MFRSIRTHIVVLGLAALFAGVQSPALAASCSVPISGGDSPRSNDCLYILRAAVGTKPCELCVCDADGSAAIVASDAHLCLRTAVGLATTLECPPCTTTTTVVEETTTTTLAPTTTTMPASTTTTTFAPTTTLPPNEACPGSVEWTTHGMYGAACDTNADCDAGDCDVASGRCRTGTRFDVGWIGLSHDMDLGEGATTRLNVRCESGEAPCGECEIVGIDSSSGNCRCANDSRILCDQPFDADADDCAACTGGERNGRHCASAQDCPGGACSGAAVCQCYQSPPIPLSASGTPFCMLPRFAADPHGTVNVDTGESSVALSMRMAMYIGIGTRAPCPICGGTCSNSPTKFCVRDEDCPEGGTCDDDDTPNDGVRGGVCTFGADYLQNAGETCDKGAFHASFPAYPSGPSGGWYSLDCMPDVGKNASGQGLRLTLTETTGSVSLGSKVSCQGPAGSLDCPCLVCALDPSVPCNSDEDCADVLPACDLGTGGNAARCQSNADCAGASGGTCNVNLHKCSAASSFGCDTNADCSNLDLGACEKTTCTAKGSGDFPQPNQCTGLDCTDSGNGVGVCTSGPDAQYCNGVVEADGSGILSCSANIDCAAGTVGVDAGSCSLTERNGCFLDPVEAIGNADPQKPLLAETFCMPTVSSSGKNAALGLPGPARALKQTTLRAFCDANPEKMYSPGSGGCEP